MIDNEKKLDEYRKKMMPKIKKSLEEANAKPLKISVKKQDGGDLLTLEKSSLIGKPLNLWVDGSTVRFWRKDASNIEFEGDMISDLVVKYQYAGIASPWGVGAVSISLNTEDSHLTDDYQAGWSSFKVDVSEKDVDTFKDFVKRNRLVGFEYNKLCSEYLDFFEDHTAALNMQAGNGKLENVKRLIELGFAVDAVECSFTPLLSAIKDYYPDENQEGVISYLLSLGADPNIFDFETSEGGRGDTALFLLLDKIEGDKELKIMEELLRHGADPNQKNAAGDTVLCLIAYQGGDTAPEAARLLLKYNANPQLEGEDGRSALEIAHDEENTELENVLSGK